MRLGLDALALAALLYGLFLPRHKRMDLVVVYALFNLGLLLALVVISQGQVSMGVGFGLFPAFRAGGRSSGSGNI